MSPHSLLPLKLGVGDGKVKMEFWSTDYIIVLAWPQPVVCHHCISRSHGSLNSEYGRLHLYSYPH